MKHEETKMGSGWGFAERVFAEKAQFPVCLKCSKEKHPDESTQTFKCNKGCDDCTKNQEASATSIEAR